LQTAIDLRPLTASSQRLLATTRGESRAVLDDDGGHCRLRIRGTFFLCLHSDRHDSGQREKLDRDPFAKAPSEWRIPEAHAFGPTR
jgi:hypothetical protein